MRHTLAAFLVAALVALPAAFAGAEEGEISFLFVQSAEQARYQDGRLTLGGVSPTTIFFSDRPARIAGHVPVSGFIEAWGEGGDSFEQDPPNAVLSVLREGEDANIVVELSSPVLDGDSLSFDAKVLQGEMPAEGGPVTLFIDGLVARAAPGAARGAALGAVGGAIGGDAGKGAAIGAAVGGLGSIMRQNQAARNAYSVTPPGY